MKPIHYLNLDNELIYLDNCLEIREPLLPACQPAHFLQALAV